MQKYTENIVFLYLEIYIRINLNPVMKHHIPIKNIFYLKLHVLSQITWFLI